MKSSTVLLCLGFFFAFVHSANAAKSKNEEKEQVIPPQEIYDACLNKEIGDKCSYIDNLKKTVSGQCIKDTRVIVCIPQEEPPKKEE